MAKQATSRRTASSGWLSKVDAADVLGSVAEVDGTMVGVTTVEMVEDTTLAVMGARLGHRRSMPTWQKCKPRSCNSVWQLTRRRRSKESM